MDSLHITAKHKNNDLEIIVWFQSSKNHFVFLYEQSSAQNGDLILPYQITVTYVDFQY